MGPEEVFSTFNKAVVESGRSFFETLSSLYSKPASPAPSKPAGSEQEAETVVQSQPATMLFSMPKSPGYYAIRQTKASELRPVGGIAGVTKDRSRAVVESNPPEPIYSAKWVESTTDGSYYEPESSPRPRRIKTRFF